ncbi:hypothetical protein [Nonomuraea sp. NPDC049028]|uniref:hypothetical protein n=1 Tax=Nonomuraea sp. NPDC049028 TaxID=3364348 RepID=UPI003712F51F
MIPLLDPPALTRPCDLINQGPLDQPIGRVVRDDGTDDLAGAALRPATERAAAAAQTMRTPALPLDAELRISDGRRGQWYSGCADVSGNGGLR